MQLEEIAGSLGGLRNRDILTTAEPIVAITMPPSVPPNMRDKVARIIASNRASE